VFTMVQKAGLRGFCPDTEGPAHSTYNQLHRHLAVSAFQFLSSSFALIALNVNNYYASDHNLCTDMYDNFVYGTLAQNTKKEIRRPGSLSHALRNSVANKARTRVCCSFFHCAQTNPNFRKPDTHHHNDPLLPPSEIGLVLPLNVPIDFFTPEFYNSLTMKERARYIDTGIAFPLEQYAFNDAHAHWMKMGKAEFMKAYGNEVLAQYNIPTPEEITEQSDSDADDEEEEEIDL
ncbi:hypothetical protein DFH07DRAFT_698316, partial [Mycena maculata]